MKAVKELLDYKKPDKKKEVEYLYIEADEDHYNLQFQNIVAA